MFLCLYLQSGKTISCFSNNVFCSEITAPLIITELLRLATTCVVNHYSSEGLCGLHATVQSKDSFQIFKTIHQN
jgi:hypothetical protein